MWSWTSLNWWQFQQKEPSRAGSPLKTPAPRKKKSVPLWFLSAWFCLTEEHANLVLSPTNTSFTWARARAFTTVAEIVGDVLFLSYFRTCLCRTMGHPFLSSPGESCPSQHFQPCRSLPCCSGSCKYFVDDTCNGLREEFLTQLHPACITLFVSWATK